MKRPPIYANSVNVDPGTMWRTPDGRFVGPCRAVDIVHYAFGGGWKLCAMWDDGSVSIDTMAAQRWTLVQPSDHRPRIRDEHPNSRRHLPQRSRIRKPGSRCVVSFRSIKEQ